MLPDSFLAVDYMLDRFAWLVEGLVVRPERMRANLDASHGLFFSQRLLLALVEAGSPATTRTGSCSATRCARGTRGSTSASSSRPTPRSPARVDLDEVFDLDAYTAHVDTVFERLRALVASARRRVHA